MRPRLQVSQMASLLYACRRHLAGLLKEHSLVEGGDLQVATWIKDEGFDTTIPSVMQVPRLRPLSDLHMCVLPPLVRMTRPPTACA